MSQNVTIVSVTPAHALDPHAPTEIPPPTLSPQCAATHKFHLYTTSTFQKKIIRPGVSYTIAHRLFHILNIITPLVLSRDTADVQLILEITCCIDA